jgi:protein-disulfide isomerase
MSTGEGCIPQEYRHPSFHTSSASAIAAGCYSCRVQQRPSFELVVPVSPVDHILGPAQASLTLVEYGDFECPNCKQAFPAVKLLLRDFRERLRFVYRHFPLEEVHPHALNAAQAAECAGAQGKFWAMHDLLFEHQHALKAHHLREYAQQLELDLTRFTAEMGDTVYLQRIREHQQGGLESGARATPTFFLEGKLVDVSFGLQALHDAVEKAARGSP